VKNGTLDERSAAAAAAAAAAMKRARPTTVPLFETTTTRCSLIDVSQVLWQVGYL
jgi:hypothetical protein